MFSAKTALSYEALACLPKLPRNELEKVTEFFSKFWADPTSNSINYEKIHNAIDDDYRSVRISQNYRGIVKKPKQGNLYILLYVDKHDEAYRWAERRKCEIDEQSGAIRVFESVHMYQQLTESNAVRARSGAGVLAHVSESKLLQMGVPQEWLQTVKALETEEQLNELAEWLPAGAWENVYFLFEGFSVDEVMQQMIVKEQRGLYETQRHFLIAENEYELRSMLDAPLEKWRVFLHPMQRALVEHHWKGPVKVLGGAGTGKTVVAMHRAKFLVEQVFTQEHERILLTTYTKSLAADIQGQLQQICRPETLHRIEVVNIDRWLLQFLSSEGVARDVLFQPAEHHLWRTALEFHDRTMPFTELFYRDEWELVVQEHDVFTLEQYLQVDRVGRGTRLDRAQRERLWPVFAEYRKFLEQARKWEQPDAIRQALRQLALRAAPLYRAVIVDEVQDMSNHVLKLLRALAGPQKDNDLFLVGDVHQRIYRRFPRLSNGGIDVLGRSRKLYINYRTTDEIRKWAIEMLAAFTADDLEGGSDPLRGYRSLTFGMKPDILRFADADQELEHVVDRLRGLNREQLNQTCIVARSNELLDRYAEALESARVDVLRLSNQQNDDRTAPGVRLATMHRVKGLEFETVIMVAVNEGLLPKSDSPEMSHENDRDRADFLQRERALLYVAATRAKRHLIVCGYGKPSPFLE